MRARLRGREPERVRAVVTLGSPVWGDLRRYTNVWKLYERVAGHPVDDPPIPRLRGEAAGADAGDLVAPRRHRRRRRRRGGPRRPATKRWKCHSTHMGFAVSRKGTREAVREIVRFLEEVEAAESRD